MITVSTENRVLGTISLDNGQLKASTPGLQRIADSKVRQTGSAATAYQLLANTSNGYVHFSEASPATKEMAVDSDPVITWPSWLAFLEPREGRS